MDRALNALVNLEVPADIVRIDVRGSLNQDSRPDLVHIIRRVRRMGIRSHIRVDLSQAAMVESTALAGLRGDLNALDSNTLPGIYGAGVSLDLIGSLDGASPIPANDRQLLLDGPAGRTFDDGRGLEGIADGLLPGPDTGLEELCGRPLEEYSDEDLLAASDMLFALLDNPKAFAGPDLLGRYNDIGQEIRRRQQEPVAPFPAAEGQAAS